MAEDFVRNGSEAGVWSERVGEADFIVKDVTSPG
jgi:hypothetical protein